MTDDLFPYEDQPGAYWTGYFETNSYFKNIIR